MNIKLIINYVKNIKIKYLFDKFKIHYILLKCLNQ